jgi:hypothetical protein
MNKKNLQPLPETNEEPLSLSHLPVDLDKEHRFRLPTASIQSDILIISINVVL